MSEHRSSSTASLIVQEEVHEGDGENPDLQNAEVDVVTSVCSCNNSTRKIASLAWMAVCLLLGVVLLVAGKVKTDTKAVQIDESAVYSYLSVILLIAIFGMAILIFQRFVKKWVPERCWTNHEEPAEQLIPRRLLVGVMFFGLGSSFMTMVEFLEYVALYGCNSAESEDLAKMIYYFVRTVFTYMQLYFFYKLSSPSKRKILFLSHFQIMHLIAINLATWIVTFVHDSAEELHSHHNATKTEDTDHNGTDPCTKTVKDLESTAKNMEPYFYTFTMEYCLISAGLLLNVWLSLSKDETRESGDHRGERGINADILSEDSEASGWVHVTNDENLQEVGTLWRFGFILGLVYVPAFTAIIVNVMFTDTDQEDKKIYISFQLFFFLSILVASLYGSQQLENQKEGEIHSKVDFYLLGGALVGVFFLDLFIIIAAVCEIRKSTDIGSLLIVTNITELLCSVAFTHFVYKALQREICKEISTMGQSQKDVILNSASRIREVVSFLFMLNICFWGMYTFEVKKSITVLKLMEEFYKRQIWFYISHIVYPLAVFFHFHGAVCMVEILTIFSKVPAKGISRSLTAALSAANQAVPT